MTTPAPATPVWNSHGRKQSHPKPKPVPKSPRRFLFDGCSMTGFVEPSSSTPPSNGAHRRSSPQQQRWHERQTARRSSPSLRPQQQRQRQHYYDNHHHHNHHQQQKQQRQQLQRHQGSVRRTYLDGIDKFSFSPGPTYDTSSLRHNPGPSSPQYSWFHGNASASPDASTKPRPHLKPATPGHTSKYPRPTMVDWSTSTVSRRRANAVAAIERPIESRSGLRRNRHNNRSVPFLQRRKTRGLRPRRKLPWGNPMKTVRKEPSAMPYHVRFHTHDDRCSSLGGNFFDEHLEPSENKEFCEAVTELEAHIQLRRANIWRTLRPKGMDLLNFPKLFYEMQ